MHFRIQEQVRIQCVACCVDFAAVSVTTVNKLITTLPFQNEMMFFKLIFDLRLQEYF